MFKNILIIGCGMIGSSILRGAISQKLCKKAYVYEKNIKYQNQIKKINKKIILIKKLDKKISDMDLVEVGAVLLGTPNITNRELLGPAYKEEGLQNTKVPQIASSWGPRSPAKREGPK